jgi:hypothetical protein
MNVFGRMSIGASVKFRRQTQSPASILGRSTPGSTRCPTANSPSPTAEAASPFGANPEFLHRLAQSPRQRSAEICPVPADLAKNTNIVTEAQLRAKRAGPRLAPNRECRSTRGENRKQQRRARIPAFSDAACDGSNATWSRLWPASPPGRC